MEKPNIANQMLIPAEREQKSTFVNDDVFQQQQVMVACVTIFPKPLSHVTTSSKYSATIYLSEKNPPPSSIFAVAEATNVGKR